MKKGEQKPQESQILDVLTKLTKRIEEATVDIHSIKHDIKAMKLDMKGIESDTAIMKVDIERLRNEMGEMKIDMGGLKTDIATMKKGIKEIKKDIEGLIETTAHILKEAVIHDEHNAFSQRVAVLEQIP